MKKNIKTFVNRLIICDVAVTGTIENNPLNLPSTFDPVDDKACIRKTQEEKKKSLLRLLAVSSFRYHDSIVKECFHYVVTEFPSSSTDGGKMYHSERSHLLHKFRQIQGAVIKLTKSERSAIVFNLSVVINALANRKSITPKPIGEFCYKNLYEEIS